MWRSYQTKDALFISSLCCSCLTSPSFSQFSRLPSPPFFCPLPSIPSLFSFTCGKHYILSGERESKHPRPTLRASGVGVGGGGEAVKICVALTLWGCSNVHLGWSHPKWTAPSTSAHTCRYNESPHVSQVSTCYCISLTRSVRKSTRTSFRLQRPNELFFVLFCAGTNWHVFYTNKEIT